MKAYFSKRHIDGIRDKKLPLSFSKPLRISLLKIVKRLSDWGGWDNNENFTVEAATDALKTFYGKERLEAFNEFNKRVPTDFAGLIKNGYPGEVIDAIEA